MALSLNIPEKGLAIHIGPDAHPARSAWSERAAPRQGREEPSLEKEGQCPAGSLDPWFSQESA